MNTAVLPVLPVRIRSLAAATAPRLLPQQPLDYAGHREIYGAVPQTDGAFLIATAERSGLAGKGGAAFPAHRKMTAVREAATRTGRRAVVVANGSEGEPASAKDKTLLRLAPHLVLDGLALAAAAVGADRTFLAVEADTGLGPYLRSAVAQRGGSAVPVTVVEVPPRFLSGQESALVSFLNGGPARPRFQTRPVFADGVDGGPTLVHNVETLAHLALIARYGPEWYRSSAPSLFTVRRAGELPTVVEAVPGVSLEQLAGPGIADAQAVLIGGYHGTWLPVLPAAGGITSRTALTADALGAPLGAGLVAILPHDRCGIVETAAVLRYLALESAGQCGPCLNGLPRMAAAFAELATPSPRLDTRRILDDLSRWAGLISGRGACRHPDGSARPARSALTTFATEAEAHAAGRCRAAGRPPMLPTGDTEQGA